MELCTTLLSCPFFLRGIHPPMRPPFLLCMFVLNAVRTMHVPWTTCVPEGAAWVLLALWLVAWMLRGVCCIRPLVFMARGCVCHCAVMLLTQASVQNGSGCIFPVILHGLIAMFVSLAFVQAFGSLQL